ncbi:bifunctional phosphopantothenoylcysteine decarboxylase/phosphopantothenate--cysteine ligase CoaBC [Acidocella aminolytica]|uniref:Coenzyme A biosynthesis bifunctional protein CoaBC n=1 Tax=Acidocella aminolytica 101 = DSM 11237 TaxID=1120923 RepID=A0A0D6PG20_9PROT|nr:bifunctional phosphopantothenoylcysteine decarboxylase/phosphopantothenate--cysteine ligase CoaBC [Acidocella aminolytica]GAN80700.1 phosphopantothenoylcysteine synthase [Acidocella aminolytica 101 = DSM 11237]GBQ37522.1 phosphopantothenoylcysteine synthase [Acidocella aminolytica 101 = DSM 11237]SHE53669.1 phosphopantothenoylcysteine decarboxylase / phosphopantothenate--cysteine ligase [Acidocella aminolytica 101 = DSM 11237]
MKRILLIVTGGIAAYKALELVRLATKADIGVTAVLTRSGAQFVTPLSLQALTGSKVYQDLFSLTDESEMGHIELSRAADLVVVAPATADILAKMTAGLADDLASTLLLATDKPVLVAPAMNVRMWQHPATSANMATLIQRGVLVVEPDEGPMACGEYGPGRLAEPPAIFAAIQAALNKGPLRGRHAIVTSGPTHEPIDPVRFIANRSSGKQGHAIASALAALGARVTLISGPVSLPDPPGLTTIHVETAREMQSAVQAALPADIAVCAAAVGDWRTATEAGQKIKKGGGAPPSLALAENPDILAGISAPGPQRPRLVVGFAAETEKLEEHAATKRARKGCDWLVANNVGGTGIMGGNENEVLLLTETDSAHWDRMNKLAVAQRLAAKIGDYFK